MEPKFKFYEWVRILNDSPRVREKLADKEGIVVGMSDPDERGCRDFGIHVNEYRRTFALAEDLLTSTGRIATKQDVEIDCRSGEKKKRRGSNIRNDSQS